MDWFEQVDGYCERLAPGLWAEPLNAVTNLAFLAVALWVWPRTHGMGRLFAAVLAVIGIGSGLFHTFANRLTGLMDVLPILAFILIYVFAASRDFLRLPLWAAGLATLAFLPFAALTGPVFARIPGIGSSAGYAPVPLLILIYAALVARHAPATARGLGVGAALLILSILFRALDLPQCGRWPEGTHFLWHLLNALMLGWMILVWTRHQAAVASRAPQGQGGGGRIS